jgi:TonB family protein
MFNNLIESSSHRKEFKRRGSFLLFTSATYVALFVLTSVISIYAYDAHLEHQSTKLELITFVPPPIAETVQPETQRTPSRSPIVGESSNADRPVRTVLIDRADNPNNPPEEVGVVAPTILPAPSNAVLGRQNFDPVGPTAGVTGNGDPNGGGNPSLVRTMDPPPAVPVPPVKKIIRVAKVLNSQALSLPKPPYPPLAKQLHIQGVISVQVLIDETGRVISAKAVSGSPFLTGEAQKAAYQARFSPTLIGDQPVKVSGVITYNFVLQ